MPVRVSPTGRIRRHIDDLFAQDRPLPDILEEVARLGGSLDGLVSEAVANALRKKLRANE